MAKKLSNLPESESADSRLIHLPSCPACGPHQLSVPAGVIVIAGYQYGVDYTGDPEKKGQKYIKDERANPACCKDG